MKHKLPITVYRDNLCFELLLRNIIDSIFDHEGLLNQLIKIDDEQAIKHDRIIDISGEAWHVYHTW